MTLLLSRSYRQYDAVLHPIHSLLFANIDQCFSADLDDAKRRLILFAKVFLDGGVSGAGE